MKYICVIKTQNNYDEKALEKALKEVLKYSLVNDKLDIKISHKKYF